MIKTYSKEKNGAESVTKNFKVREFACKDGSDALKLDTVTVGYLQAARDKFGVPILITSGYRTPAWNKKVGGATNSYHVKGQAVDHHTNGKVQLLELAKFYESIGCQGIIVYPNSGFIHIDSRVTKYFAIDYGTRIEKKTTFSAETVQAGKGTCTGNGVRVRASASITGKILTKLYKGKTFEIIGTSGDWTKVNVGGTVGYMSSQYVAVG